MKLHRLGNPNADIVLIQPVDDHDMEGIENEVSVIAESCGRAFFLIACQVEDWNKDLSPWKAPAVFGKEDFGDGAEKTLSEILDLCSDEGKTYYIGGYSLAGLFALWAAFQTDRFSGVAAASPSVWFPGFLDYMKDQKIQTDSVYLSLGDKEEKTRNPVMATVGERIREAHEVLQERGVSCVLEWNEGNHFKEPDIRTAKAFAWLMENRKKTVRVVAAIIRDGDRIFATQRGYGAFKDGWEFPGGKIEAGETPQEALRREIREELDAEIAVGDLLLTVEYDYPEFHLSMDCFWSGLAKGSKMKLLEHEAAKWLSIEELDSVNWLPADIKVVKAIKKTFSLKNDIVTIVE